ncbi:MAG: OmpA family protein [bacterium]|nr:OmpA family protein [bacterium]
MHNLPLLKIVSTFVFLLLCSFAAIAQVDVARRTTAVTYPLDEQVLVNFRGTTRYPRMRGEAKVKRTSRNGTEVELSVSKMPRPFELGRGYATYVLWAISPDGQVANLGEIKRRGFWEFDSKISVTTPLQNFALIITAEPHFLVSRPSQEIMLENLNPTAVSGRRIETTPSVQYFGNSSDFFRDTRTPEIAEIDYSKTPSTVLQAKQALALAKYAGADRDAIEDLREAETLYANAEESWRAGRKEDDVDITARKAISTAVKAEATALVRRQAREQRNEQSRNDAEVRKIEDQLSAALSEIEGLKRQLADETRARELAQRDVGNFSTQARELRAENGRLREDLGKARLEAETATARVTAIEDAGRNAQEQRQREARLDALRSNEASLIASLRRFGTVAKTERGIVLTLAETYWSGPRATTFAPVANARLTSLGELLVSNTDYRVQIESHTDATGDPSELSSLTDQRSKAIAERLSQLGVSDSRIEPRGLGATLPVAPNTTNASKARNRRVQMILVPSI